MFRTSRRLAVVTAALSTAGLLAGAAPASASYAWGTGPRTHAATTTTQTVVTAVRVGHHLTYDRLVLQFRGPIPGYDVRYVSVVRADPSDKVVLLLGRAKLRIVLNPTSTRWHAPQGTLTPRFPEIRQVKGAGDFEAVTSYGVGLTSRQAFRVFTLRAPNRLVVDFRLPH